jgi:hypothetical protein
MTDETDPDVVLATVVKGCASILDGLRLCTLLAAKASVRGDTATVECFRQMLTVIGNAVEDTRAVLPSPEERVLARGSADATGRIKMVRVSDNAKD